MTRTRRVACRFMGAPLAALVMGLAMVGPADAGHGLEGVVRSVAPEQVKRLLDAGETLVLVDLRPADRYRAAHLTGARSVPLTELEWRISDVPRTGRLILYGEAGYEPLEAFAILQARGYRNMSVLADGFDGWVRRGYPVQSVR